MAEKQAMDESMKSLENRNEALIRETERLRSRLRELEDNHEDVIQREQDLAHQQQTLQLGVDEATKGMSTGVLQVYLVIDVVKCAVPLCMLFLSHSFILCVVYVSSAISICVVA